MPSPVQLRLVQPSARQKNVASAIQGLRIASDPHQAMRLGSMLQFTLDIEKILTTFFHELSAIIPLAGVNYTNTADEIECALGQQGRHQLSYQLKINDEPLGTLIYSRKVGFSIFEIERLEELLGALLFPLRNALHYFQAKRAALRDPLTGIGNRHAMERMLSREMSLASRYDQALSIMMLDIDKFKHINDTYGHLCGDTVLKQLAHLVEHCLRKSDIAFRYGGEEFVIILGRTSLDQANDIAERICQQISEHNISYQQDDIKVTVSIGISALNLGDSQQSLIGRADKALYQAKAEGRNRVLISP